MEIRGREKLYYLISSNVWLFAIPMYKTMEILGVDITVKGDNWF